MPQPSAPPPARVTPDVFATLGEDMAPRFPGERKLFIRDATEAEARATVLREFPGLAITYAGYYKPGCFEVCVRLADPAVAP